MEWYLSRDFTVFEIGKWSVNQIEIYINKHGTSYYNQIIFKGFQSINTPSLIIQYDRTDTREQHN